MTRMSREFEEEKRAAEARGDAKGEANGVAKSVRALMASMKVSAKEANSMHSSWNRPRLPDAIFRRFCCILCGPIH